MTNVTPINFDFHIGRHKLLFGVIEFFSHILLIYAKNKGRKVATFMIKFMLGINLYILQNAFENGLT